MISRKLLLVAAVAVHALSLVVQAEQKVLFEKVSPYTKVMVTEDDRGLRTLLFGDDGVRQSVVKPGDPDHLELQYARAMPAGLAFVEDPRRVLIVGLGGATIPSFLRKHYPLMTIDVVDIDPVVVEAAKKFFGFREDAAMRAYVQDGRRFIEECRDPYDIIFLDAFGAENIPYHLATREFLEAVRRALKPKGAAVGNIWGPWSNPLYDSMVRTYEVVFDELYELDVQNSGNKIIIGLPREQEIGRDELAKRATAISTARDFPFDMGPLVAYGYRRGKREGSSGRVLRDKDKARTEAANAP